MQQALEDKYPSRHSFAGADGIPFSETIQCIEDTVESWKALCQRLALFDVNLKRKSIPMPLLMKAGLSTPLAFQQREARAICKAWRSTSNRKEIMQ